MSDLKYNLSTDEEHVIKLDSTLIYAEWSRGVAYAGQKARLEVGTAFVGQGAKIEIKGKSEGGKSLGKISSSIHNNKFVGELEIPEDIDIGDQIYFEVKLPDNDLEGESSRIPVLRAPKVSNMKWSAKEARRGDILKLTADVEHVYAGTEATVNIYEYDENGAHDTIAKIPAEIKDGQIEIMWEYEYHEDTDGIPTEEEMKKYGGKYNPPEYFFVIEVGDAEYGKNRESKLLKFKDWFEVTLRDNSGRPMAGEKFTLLLPDGTKKEGKLDDDGCARVRDIPPGKVIVKFPDFEPFFIAEDSK